jgi:hypothetical protein
MGEVQRLQVVSLLDHPNDPPDPVTVLGCPGGETRPLGAGVGLVVARRVDDVDC